MTAARRLAAILGPFPSPEWDKTCRERSEGEQG